MDLTSQPKLRLGRINVSPATREIVFPGGREVIEPRVMQVLVVLARANGEVVSRDTLIETCWDNRVVSEGAIDRVISLLRKISGLTGGEDFHIDTIAKVGYRLVARHEDEQAPPAPTAEPASAVAPPPAPAANAARASTIALDPDPAKPPASRSWFQKPAVVGGALLAAIAIIAVAAFTLTRPSGAPAQKATSQRIAFFGFTASSDDPVVADMAAAATNETFQGLLALRLEAASRADTQGVALAQQRAKADELGAAYALGGDVRSIGGAINIQMHLEDVASRTTLWERTVSGGAADKVSLPVLAAGAATGVARCTAGARPSLPHQDGGVLAQLATACATPYIAWQDAPVRWRALAKLAPNSAVIQASLSISLIYYANHADLAAAGVDAAWKEAAASANQALAIDPNNGAARTVLAYYAIYEGRPLAEAGALMDAGLRDSPDDWRRGDTGSNRNEFLQGVGRNAESLAAAQDVIKRDPLSPTPYLQLAEALLHVGRGAEAARVFEQLNARWPDAWWNLWPTFAVRYGISDINQVLAAAPPAVSEESKTCWRQLAKAYASTSPAVRRAGADIAAQCGADGRIYASTAEEMRLRLLGDVEGVLAGYGASLDHRLPSSGILFNAATLLDKYERAFRASPRFLPMMKKSGLYQYWLDTGTHPDVCDDPAEMHFEVCTSLRADQAKK